MSTIRRTFARLQSASGADDRFASSADPTPPHPAPPNSDPDQRPQPVAPEPAYPQIGFVSHLPENGTPPSRKAPEATPLRLTHTSPDTPPASPPPAPAPPRSESAAPSPSPDNTAPSSSTPAGYPPVPAKKEKPGIGLVSPDESSTLHPAENSTAIPSAPAAVFASECDIHTSVRTPPPSSPGMPPPAPHRLPSGTQTPAARSTPCIPAGIQTADPPASFNYDL